MKKTVESPLDKRLYTQNYNGLGMKVLKRLNLQNFIENYFHKVLFEDKGIFSGKPNGILVQVKEQESIRRFYG